MEDFVTFEIAKKLKEKGFPQSPDWFNYISYYEWDGLRKIHSLSNASVWFDPNIDKENIYFAPTISQTLKWLRKEKDIFIEIEYINQEDCGCTIILQETGDLIAEWNWDKFKYANKNPLVRNTYEQTALAGIEYVIDNLIY